MGRHDSEHLKSDRQLLEESVQRSRRVETKLSTLVEGLGFDAGGKKPVVEGREVIIPTPQTSIADIAKAIGGIKGALAIRCGDDYLGYISL